MKRAIFLPSLICAIAFPLAVQADTKANAGEATALV